MLGHYSTVAGISLCVAIFVYLSYVARRAVDDELEDDGRDAEETVAFWHEWMAHEVRFLAEQRPWERACLVVAGSPTIDLDEGQFAVAPAPSNNPWL